MLYVCHQIFNNDKQMNVEINGKVTDTKAQSLQELAEELKLPAKGVAIAVGNSMVPRTDWPASPLKENDRIVIIKAACGG